jgi:hypothetical protein
MMRSIALDTPVATPGPVWLSALAHIRFDPRTPYGLSPALRLGLVHTSDRTLG